MLAFEQLHQQLRQGESGQGASATAAAKLDLPDPRKVYHNKCGGCAKLVHQGLAESYYAAAKFRADRRDACGSGRGDEVGIGPLAGSVVAWSLSLTVINHDQRF